MKKGIVRLLHCTAILLLATSGALAQEFFRDLGPSRSSAGYGPIYPSEFSYEDSSPSGLAPLRPGQDLNVAQAAEEADRYNFAIGPVQFGLAVGVGIEFNDNITLADQDTLSDFIFRPFLDVQGIWRISELNTLRLSVGLSYAKYFEHSQYDSSILLTPSTEMAFTFYVSELKFTVRDRISYQEDNYDIAIVGSNEELYRRWQNQAGIQVDWPINDKVTLTGGYDYYTLWSLGDSYSQEDRATQTFFLKPSYLISPGVTVGINASYSLIDFTSFDRPNGQALLIGPFVQWQMTEYTNLYLEGGYQNLTFDQLNADNVNAILYNNQDDDSTYYVKFEINNKPSDVFEHTFSFSKTSETGYSSNYYDLFHVEYLANWKCFRNTEISPLVFYEYYEASGSGGEQASRVGAGVGIRYHFSNSITLGLDYRFVGKDSDLPDSDYRQNLALLSLYYKF